MIKRRWLGAGVVFLAALAFFGARAAAETSPAVQTDSVTVVGEKSLPSSPPVRYEAYVPPDAQTSDPGLPDPGLHDTTSVMNEAAVPQTAPATTEAPGGRAQRGGFPWWAVGVLAAAGLAVVIF